MGNPQYGSWLPDNETVYLPLEPIVWCEYCGKPGYTEEHHIKTRGAGGKDIELNKIRLCVEHHRASQEYKIDHLALVQLVAKREKVTPEEVCQAIGITVPDKFQSIQEKEQEPGIEELIQAYISLEEQERDSKWAKAQLLEAMLSAGAKASWLASQLEISVSLIRKMVKTFKAFPEEDTRVCELDFEHHFVAATSDKPAVMIARAADEQLSTRQMRKLIVEEEASSAVKEIAKDEDKKEMHKAQAAVVNIKDVLTRGGPAAEWVKKELLQLVG